MKDFDEIGDFFVDIGIVQLGFSNLGTESDLEFAPQTVNAHFERIGSHPDFFTGGLIGLGASVVGEEGLHRGEQRGLVFLGRVFFEIADGIVENRESPLTIEKMLRAFTFDFFPSYHSSASRESKEMTWPAPRRSAEALLASSLT